MTLAVRGALEIRYGNNSDGDLVDWNSYGDIISPSGLYVRLRMTCSVYGSFNAVFAWFQESYGPHSMYCGVILNL